MVFLVCTFKKAIKNFKVKVGVQKDPVWSRDQIKDRCARFIQFTIFIQIACVLRSEYYRLHSTEGKVCKIDHNHIPQKIIINTK